MVSVLLNSGDPWTLSYCQIPKSQPGLPLWVPYWSRRCARNAIGSETGFSASEGSQPSVKFSTANDDPHRLSTGQKCSLPSRSTISSLQRNRRLVHQILSSGRQILSSTKPLSRLYLAVRGSSKLMKSWVNAKQ